MSTGAVYTGDFISAFEAQTQRILRTRFMWFLGTVGLTYLLVGVVRYAKVGLLAMVPGFLGPAAKQMLDNEILQMRGGLWGLRLVGILTAADIVVYVACFWWVLKRPLSRQDMLRLTQWFLIYLGTIDAVTRLVTRDLGFPFNLMLYHTFACALLPWTAEQAIRPMGPLLLLNAVLLLLIGEMTGGKKAFTIVMTLFAAAPGVILAHFKHSWRMDRFKNKVIEARYGQMRRELVDARRIHEALFPPPITTGPVRLDYRYEPMRQIGGDYLYARFTPGADAQRPGAFNILLLDVTGHGIAAALTVNRLYGEVERLYAENPHAGPDEVMCALNRYVHLTLANHSIYATALCARVDIDHGRVEFASGGHPPAFLCTADGRIEQLDSTSFVLGACAAHDFKANVQSWRFEPGDTLIAYTDGAIECRNAQGRMLGVNGFLRVLASCVQMRGSVGGAGGREPLWLGFAGTLLSAVDSHRAGPAEDDTLVVEIVRTADTGPVPRIRTGAAAQAAAAAR